MSPSGFSAFLDKSLRRITFSRILIPYDVKYSAIILWLGICTMYTLYQFEGYWLTVLLPLVLAATLLVSFLYKLFGGTIMRRCSSDQSQWITRSLAIFLTSHWGIVAHPAKVFVAVSVIAQMHLSAPEAITLIIVGAVVWNKGGVRKYCVAAPT